MVSHKDVLDKVIVELKSMDLTGFGFKASDIKYTDFPFHMQPSFGLLVSPLDETEGESTNETTDIGYPVQLVRCGHKLDPTGGITGRDAWRRAVWRRFNRVRLGVSDDDGCELITRSEFLKLQMKDTWDKWNLDSSALKVVVWIRELHN